MYPIIRYGFAPHLATHATEVAIFWQWMGREKRVVAISIKFHPINLPLSAF